MRGERRALDQWASATVRGVVARGGARPPPSSPAGRRRLGVWTLMPLVGRVWRRRAAHPDPAGTGQAAEGRAGVSRVGGQERRPGSGPQAGQALCTPRIARALSCLSPGVYPEPARPTPLGPPIPSFAMRYASRAASTLEPLPWSLPWTSSPCSPRVSIPLLAMRSPSPVSFTSRIRTELEGGHSWESKRKVAGDG